MEFEFAIRLLHMTVSRKVALVNIQIEAHTTEAKKFSCLMSPSPYYGPGPMTWAGACNMGRARAHGTHGPLAPGPGPGPKKGTHPHYHPPLFGPGPGPAQGAHGSHGPGPGQCCRHLPMSLARAHNMGLDSSGKGIYYGGKNDLFGPESGPRRSSGRFQRAFGVFFRCGSDGIILGTS